MTPPTPAAWQRVTDTLHALGESPFWHPQEERLYWVDIALQHVWRHHVPSQHTERWELPQTPGAIAPCRSGGLLLALRDGIYRASGWGDLPQLLVRAPYDTERLRFNDGKCDPWGRFWVGTYVETRDKPDGALYCLQTMGRGQPELHEVARGVMASNGLAWSPDGHTLYWADTARHEVNTRAVLSDGHWPPELAPAMLFAHRARKPEGWTYDLHHGEGYQGRPDGAAVDQVGNYWVALYEGARLACYAPDGRLLKEIATPAQCPTMVCFGGRDLRTLYLTTARQHRSPAELARFPDSGGVFALRVETPGLPVNPYWD